MQGDVLSIIENKAQNYLINGHFGIDQRNAGAVISPVSKYGLDRWFFASGTSCRRVAVTGQNFLFALEGTATAAGNAHIQRIESGMVYHLKNKTVTFSIKMRLVSGSLGGLPMLRVSYANAKDDFSATTLVSDYTLESDSPIDGTYKIFKKSFVVTEQMANNGFSVQFGDFSAGTNVVRFAQAMLNEGSYASKFQLAGKTRIGEIALCQRYFEKSYDLETPVGEITVVGEYASRSQGSTSSYYTIFYKTRKRSSSVLTPYNPTTGTVGTWRDNTGAANRAATTAVQGESSGVFLVTTPTDNQLIVGHWTADAEL